MLFTSFHFLIFFPLIFLFYYLLPQKFRWVFLLIASMAFYMVFSWQYLLFFIGLILINYKIGRSIYNTAGQFRKGLYISGILFNILVLCFFKYFNFPDIEFIRIADLLHLRYPLPMIRIILPLGLSYLIFTLLAYLIDIKRQEIKAEKHAGILALYFLFFPKIAQGPIERAGRIIPQLHSCHPFDYNAVTGGLKLMTWGFFKKLVVSDTLALFVNTIYADPGHFSGPFLIIGLIFFSFQLYADFSGYTDIALGAAQTLGFTLSPNFRQPFLASSIRDFWTRWHISLSSWCTDYIFLPIVEHTYDFKRRLKKHAYLHFLSAEKIMYILATIVTFLIIGIWHGAGWNYVLLGLLFGFYVSFDMLTKKFRKRINEKTGITRFPLLFQNIQILTTFFLLCIAWIFFRSANLSEAGSIFVHLFQGWSWNDLALTWTYLFRHGINERILGIMIISTAILIITDKLSEKKDIFHRLSAQPAFIRWAIYYLILLIIMLYGATENRQFIYLQF